MKVQPAAFLRTTLPLDLSKLGALDSGRYHSIWLPDHMVSFWPESIWTPEFTDLATVSPSPHRHLDAMAVAGAAAVLTKNVPIATSVVDTVRRHPAMLAQSALTIHHLSRGDSSWVSVAARRRTRSPMASISQSRSLASRKR